MRSPSWRWASGKGSPVAGLATEIVTLSALTAIGIGAAAWSLAVAIAALCAVMLVVAVAVRLLLPPPIARAA